MYPPGSKSTPKLLNRVKGMLKVEFNGIKSVAFMFNFGHDYSSTVLTHSEFCHVKQNSL